MSTKEKLGCCRQEIGVGGYSRTGIQLVIVGDELTRCMDKLNGNNCGGTDTIPFRRASSGEAMVGRNGCIERVK